MRCLSCRQNGLPETTKVCPLCGAQMKVLLRDMLPSGTKLHNERYRIDYPLGRGGFGITYHAFDTTFDLAVVIKEFFPQEQAMRKGRSGTVAVPTTQQGSYEKALHQFLEEARILAKIKKDNVVRVFDYFKHHNTAYIVMEMVEGHTLRELLDRQPQRHFSSDKVEMIVGQMVVALAAIHRHGVFHLDISPDNVLETDEGKIVLIDFGAARQTLRTSKSHSIDKPHQFKLAYAAPEILAPIARGQRSEVGQRSDLFELGMMTYELLTGALPPSVLQRATEQDPWRPRLSDARWQKALDQALQLKPEMRPATVQEWWDLYRRRGIVFGPRTKATGIVIGERIASSAVRGSGKKN